MATLHPQDRPMLDISEQIARIDKMQAELQKISAEQAKILAETLQVQQTTRFEPWRIYAAAGASAVALFGAATALVKLVL